VDGRRDELAVLRAKLRAAEDALHAIYAAASGSGVAVPEWADEAQKLRDEAAELGRQIRRRLAADEP